MFLVMETEVLKDLYDPLLVTHVVTRPVFVQHHPKQYFEPNITQWFFYSGIQCDVQENIRQLHCADRETSKKMEGKEGNCKSWIEDT